MTALEPLRPEMFDEIYDSFLDDGDPLLTKDDWRPLFPRCADDQQRGGMALVDGGKVVGLLGMLFSERTIGGRAAQFCNLHSWYVQPDYRGKSLLLMRPALRLTNHTLTDFTPTERVCAISTRLGFKPLDAAVRILLPLRRKARHGGGQLQITGDVESIAAKLPPEQRLLLRGHQQRPCEHLLASNEHEHCYLICTRVERCRLPYRHILYISDLAFFERMQAPIRSYLLRDSRAAFAAIDNRLVSSLKFPFSFRLPAQSRQLYRSANLKPRHIDHLHSEVSLLGLSTFPSLGHKVRQLADRLRVGWVLPRERTSLELSTPQAARRRGTTQTTTLSPPLRLTERDQHVRGEMR